MITVSVAHVYDSILDETKLTLWTEKNGKAFAGKLFMEPVAETCVEKLATVKFNDNATNIEVANGILPMLKKYHLLAKDGKTFQTIAHWLNMNGVTTNLDLSYLGK